MRALNVCTRCSSLAEDAGARVETLAGTNAVEAITGYIRRHNITKAVIGRPPEKRWRSARAIVVALRLAIGLERRQPSGDFAEALARQCPEVDVIRAAADPAHIQLPPRAADIGRADVRSEAQRVADAQASWPQAGLCGRVRVCGRGDGAVQPRAASVRSGQHRHAVPGRRGGGGDAPRARAGGAGIGAVGGAVRFLLRAATIFLCP